MAETTEHAALEHAEERLDNLIHAMLIPVSAELHLKALRVALPEIRDEIRAAIAKAEGSDV